MVRRNSLSLFVLVILTSVAANACGHFELGQAQSLVKHVGTERIREAAQELRKFREMPNQKVPPESWPKALEELKPESISVNKGGVTISKYGFFVEEEGLYIVFDGEAPPEERSGDPSFQKIAEGIYWYQHTG
jgi:hypothetical protein